MKPRINHSKFIGNIIGKVKIVRFSHSVEHPKNNKFIYYYEFVCECGNLGIAPKYSLLQSGKNRNTFCCEKCRKDKLSAWAKDAKIKYKNPIEGKCSILCSNYRSRAKKKGLEFTLTFEQFMNMTTSNCHYCGLEPNKCRQDRAKSRMGISRVLFNGIDRIDSLGGYTLDNCVPCCEDCNKAKRNLSYDDFLSLVERIYNFKIKKDDIGDI